MQLFVVLLLLLATAHARTIDRFAPVQTADRIVWPSSAKTRSADSIPVPSAAQARYQSTDFIALIHFNMGTFAHNGDPCCDSSNWNVDASYAAGKTSDPATFNPELLDTDNWMKSITDLGANIAILTAKHGCGFCLWPTKAVLPDGKPYGYNVGSKNAAIKYDVLRRFVNSAKAWGVGYGFYYSIMKSFYLCHSFSGGNSCMNEILKNQYNLTAEQYTDIAKQHVTELWTEYGDLTEIWVDSGLGGFGDLMVKLQPQAVGTPHNPTGWCGTESGHPSRDVGSAPVWSTGNGNHGDPNATNWNPKFCDPQLFQEHVWFWEAGLKVRTLEMMIPIYHDIVGRGMVMELAFSIDRRGLVDDTHARVYKQLGDWVRACYGTPLASTSGVGEELLLTIPAGHVVDRFQITEDIVTGERVRKFSIAIVNRHGPWETLAEGSAIGRKRILLLETAFFAEVETNIRLQIQDAIAPPHIKQFSAFGPCPKK